MVADQEESNEGKVWFQEHREPCKPVNLTNIVFWGKIFACGFGRQVGRVRVEGALGERERLKEGRSLSKDPGQSGPESEGRL